jgi:selT/selW/selH-like putative selenoprotein
MAITAERFAAGLTYTEYKAQMTRNRERLEANEAKLTLAPDELAFFARLPQPLRVLVLAEDWCGDVINNLPVLARLAAESGKLELRIFLRDQNLDLMDHYLKDGQFRSIPVFAFFDADFRELGHWIERPVRISELQAQMRRELFASDPLLAGYPSTISPSELPEEARARLMAAFVSFREEHRALADSEVVRELRAVLEHGALPVAATAPEVPAVGLPAAAPAATNGAGNGHASGPLKVSITYCAACGYEPQTLELTRALLYAFGHDLAAVELIPWQDGAFDVVVGGELVHSMYRDGGFPPPEQIVQAVRERLGS